MKDKWKTVDGLITKSDAEALEKIGERPFSKTVKPTVICICGSTRFGDVMAVLAWEQEKKGYLSLGCHLLPDWYWKNTGKTENHHGAEQEGVAHILDELHLRKIDMARIVWICNVGGYVGERTRIEAEYARSMGKVIIWLEPDKIPDWWCK